MKGKMPLLLGFSFVMVAGLAAIGFIILSNQPSKGSNQPTPSSQLTPLPTPTPTPMLPQSPTDTPVPVGPSIPSGWLTYTNTQYGFALSYPPSYEALDDADNLYGWPDAVVLFYGGGQSYDLPVEVWDLPTEYLVKYPSTMTNVTVQEVNGKFITLFNQNMEPEVDQIIATFREI